MTKKLLFLGSLQLLIITGFGQDISRQEADSMLQELDNRKPDLERVELLLHLAQFHIFKPGEFQVDFDSAMVYINEAKVLNKALKSPDADGYLLLTESFLIREKGQRDEARKMTEKAVTILESRTSKLYLGIAYYELAWYYDYYDDIQLPQKIRLVEQSVKCFQQARNTKRKARALEMLGDLYVINDEESKAIVVLKEALAAYDTLKHQPLQGVYVILGGAYNQEEDYGQALFYLLKALKTAHAVGDTSMQLCNINNQIGALYSAIGRPEMAVKYIEDALQTTRKYQDENTIFFLTVNLAICFEINGQPERGLEVLASIPESYRSSLKARDKSFVEATYLRNYLSLRRYDKVPPLIQPLLAIAEGRTLIPKERSIIHRLVATYYFRMNQYSKARECLTKNHDPDIATDSNYKMGRINDARLWYKLDSAQGDFRSAFNHLLFYQTKMDSILSENKVRQLQVLGVEYDVGMKENSIKQKDKEISLLTQRNRLHQANLKQASLIRNITVAATIMASIVIVLLHRQFRQKQKTNRLITQKNEELQHYLREKEWLLKEIHHRVKNNLQTIMGLLGTQSRYLKNDVAIDAIRDSQRRIQSMSLIHQKLYQSKNLSAIGMVDYIHELVGSLSDSFNVSNRVRFKLDIEPIELDLTHCIPLGLILNEAINNSFKHAFQDERPGVISISLKNTRENDYLLIIKDNGPGLLPGFNVDRSDSMGMNLMRGLSAEIGAQFNLSSHKGVQVEISFTYGPEIDVEVTPIKSRNSVSV